MIDVSENVAIDKKRHECYDQVELKFDFMTIPVDKKIKLLH